MNVLQITKSTNAVNIWFDEIKMYLILDDGRELSIPINWFPSLRDATPDQRNNWRFIGDGEGIHWEDLDEDILVEGLLQLIWLFQLFHLIPNCGFFRLLPYPLIRKWTREADYVMSYFHPRDFDAGQPMLPQLPMMRKFKSYVGLKGAFRKFEHWLNDFETVSLLEADAGIKWEETKIISM